MFSSSPQSSASGFRPRVPRFRPLGLLLALALGATTLARSAEVKLSWNDNSSNESGFKVERASGTSGSFAQIATTGANTRSFVDRNVTTKSTYRYRVRAYNGAGNSAYSGIATVTVPATTTTNTAPTISAISDRSLKVNQSTGTVSFTIGDAHTSASSLKLTKSSSNTTLVPLSNMVFGGSGANRTIKVTPAANRTGSSTIAIKVSDGSLSRTETFVVKVSSSGSGSVGSTSGGNTAPTISAISDRTISVNGSTGPISFKIGDGQTGAWNLKITKTASNTSLTPASGMVFGGSSANRTITIKPAPNRTGSSTISIKVSDGSLTRTETFVVTVKSPTSAGVGTASLGSSTASKFTNVAVGNPRLKGKTTIRSNGRVEIHAAGLNSKTKDQLRLAYTTLRGDSEMVVRVASLTKASSYSRAGLTYRASTGGSAAQVSLFVTPDSGLYLLSRSSRGTETRQVGRMNGRAPEWLRLIRDGDMFYALMSEDGKEWDLVEFVKVNLPDNAVAGMMASSHNANSAITAVFDNFAIY